MNCVRLGDFLRGTSGWLIGLIFSIRYPGGPGWIEPDCHDLGWVELDWFGWTLGLNGWKLDGIKLIWLNRVRVDWVELEWAGLNWIGLDWAGLNWFGLDWIEWVELT